MTKNELIFTIMEDVRKQAATDDSAKFVSPQDVAFQVAMAYDTAIMDFFSNSQNIGNYDLDYFTKTYEDTLKEDSSGRLYVNLSSQPISLPKAQGIRSVRPKDSDVQIVRITESEWLNVRQLEAFCCSPWPFCYVDFYNKKIIIQGNRPEYKMMDSIVVKIIPKFSEFGKDDEINSPTGDFNIATMVLNIMGIRPTDNTSDDGR